MKTKALCFFIACSSILIRTDAALASTNPPVILPNGQNCSLSATIDKSMRSLCSVTSQRLQDQEKLNAQATSKIEPAAGDSNTSHKHQLHKHLTSNKKAKELSKLAPATGDAPVTYSKHHYKTAPSEPTGSSR